MPIGMWVSPTSTVTAKPLWAAAKDGDAAGAEQLVETLGGYPLNGTTCGSRLGDPV
jgi:hypothetical protein